MNKKEPFLTGFSSFLFGSEKRTKQDVFRSKIDHLNTSNASNFSMLFESVLPSESLREIQNTKRMRIYDEQTTLWAWCSQILEGNASCYKAVSNVQVWREQLGLSAPSSQTKAFCDARNRLSLSFIKEANELVIKHLDTRVTSRDLWRGLELKAIDGSSMQLFDTPENQLIYPQPSEQKQGCGFPVVGVCGVVNLSHGGWETMATSALTRHDLSATYEVLEYFGERDLCLADRAYNSYEFMSLLKGQGCESIMRLHQSRQRSLEWKSGKKLGKNDRLFVWKKPNNKPPGSRLATEEWKLLPDSQKVRIVRLRYQTRDSKVAWMYLATSLLDPQEYPYGEICELYHKRWVIELKFRDVKTLLKMDMIRAKTPAVVEKTILIIQLCYNMIQSLIQAASKEHLVTPNRISFKGCVDQILSHSSHYNGHQHHPHKRQSLYKTLLYKIANARLVIRPGRSEPRAKKRRPKNYQLLTKPRHEFKEIPHRNNYRKPA